MNRLPRPTDAELEILRVLWVRGPSTVRQIHEDLRSEKDTVYTTTLKLVQNMTDKGLLLRDDAQRSHVFTAACQPEKTQRQLVRDLIARAFRGTPGKLVLQALTEEEIRAEDMAEIRRLLDELEAKRKKGDKR